MDATQQKNEKISKAWDVNVRNNDQCKFCFL